MTANKSRTVLVVTALSEERKAVISFLDVAKTGQDGRGGSFVYGYYPSAGAENCWKIILPPPTRAGNVKSAARTALSLAINPDLTFFVGVAGGFPTKVNMYDVVVAERVYFVEPAKIDTDNSYIPRPDQHKVTATLLSRAQSLQDIGGWQRLLQGDAPNEVVEVWIEPIAAGEKLVASSTSEEFKRIKSAAPRAVAVENEGFGVLEAAHEAGATALVIRGISDLLDNRPTDADARSNDTPSGRVTQDPAKFKAARHASAFMFGILELLDEEDVKQIDSADDGYVDVKMRWSDLHDLAKGRQIVLQVTDGAPIKDLKTREGSVEVEFKTVKIFAALLYAAWIEQNILTGMMENQPDSVDTIIDTSDREVSRVFVGVRLLNSSDPEQRRQGEHLLSDISASHPALASFTSRVVGAVRTRLAQTGASEAPQVQKEPDTLPEKRRISLKLSQEAIADLELIQLTRGHPSRGALVRKQIADFLEDIGHSNRAFDILGARDLLPGVRGRAVVAVGSEQVDALENFSRELGMGISEVASRIVEFETRGEMQRRSTPGASSKSPGIFAIRGIREIRDKYGMKYSEIAKLADVSQSTVRKVATGAPVSHDIAMRILAALSRLMNQDLNPDEYLVSFE